MMRSLVVKGVALGRRSFLRLTGVSIFLTFAGSVGAQRDVPAAGAVEEVKGEAFAEANSVRRRLERAAPLFMRDEVFTGTTSRMTMRLGRNTTLMLGERTRIVIDRYLVNAGGQITLGSGAMLLDRPPGAKSERLNIRSQFALIAVRGTRLFAGPSNKVFGIFVARGRVTVRAAGRRITLRAGQGTDIRRPGAKPTLPVRWGAARVRAALESVS
jgi:ferric-dicitrate binding protein FerR (iron transport regulator)